MLSLLWIPFAGKTTGDWQSNEIWNRISHKYGLPNSERVRREKTRRMPAKNSRQNRRQCRKNRKSAIATTTTTTTLPLVQVQCNNNSQEHVTHKWKCKGLPQQHNLANSSVNLASRRCRCLSTAADSDAAFRVGPLLRNEPSECRGISNESDAKCQNRAGIRTQNSGWYLNNIFTRFRTE